MYIYFKLFEGEMSGQKRKRIELTFGEKKSTSAKPHKRSFSGPASYSNLFFHPLRFSFPILDNPTVLNSDINRS